MPTIAELFGSDTSSDESDAESTDSVFRLEDPTINANAPAPAAAVPAPVVLGFIPPAGTPAYRQPRAAFARTAWDGNLNAFVRIDRNDTHLMGAVPNGYVRDPSLPGYRRTHEQTLRDEERLDQQNRAAARPSASFYGPEVADASMMEWSIYVGAMGSHAPLRWWPLLIACLTALCDHDGSAAAMGCERGDKRRLIHFQITLRLLMIEANKELLRRFIRAALNILPGSNIRVKIGLKLFTGQTWSYMLGYCQKDRGQSHFRFWSINVSDRELEVGDRTYKRVRTQSHCYFNFELAH